MKVTAVVEPKFVAAATLLVAVGAVTGLVELFAPLKVRFFAPLYPVSVLPYGSVAVIVSDCATPAVCEPEPETTRREAVAEPTVTERRSAPAALMSVGHGDRGGLGLVELHRAAGGGDAAVKVTAVVLPEVDRGGRVVGRPSAP